MVMKLVDLVGIHIEATSGAPLVLLREHAAPHRVVPIFVGGPEAASIAVALSGQTPPRPLTHDLMVSLVKGLAAHIDAVEVTGMNDGTFVATISVSGPGGIQSLDTRPSDAIALAVRVDAPLFMSDEVLDQAGAIVHEAPDEETIDETVAEFRDFLDELDPAAFAEPSIDESETGTTEPELHSTGPEPTTTELEVGIAEPELDIEKIDESVIDDNLDESTAVDDTSVHLDEDTPEGDLDA